MNTNTYDGGYYENAWDQSTEQHELHEKTPINYNQQNYMTNEVHETSVETVNMDNNYDNNYGDKSGGYAQQPYMVSEESYILIWKYMEQIKSITAGWCAISLYSSLLNLINLIFFRFSLCVSAIQNRIITAVLCWLAYRMVNLSSTLLRNIRHVSKALGTNQLNEIGQSNFRARDVFATHWAHVHRDYVVCWRSAWSICRRILFGSCGSEEKSLRKLPKKSALISSKVFFSR